MKKINKYWSNTTNTWINGYSILGIHFIKLSLFGKKNKYRVVLNLPTKYKPYFESKVSWDKNEFDNFLISIR